MALRQAQRLVAADVRRPRTRRQRKGAARAALAVVALDLIDAAQGQQAFHNPRPATQVSVYESSLHGMCSFSCGSLVVLQRLSVAARP